MFIERHPDVGYSDKRTPAKHRIQRAHAGRDIGAAPYAAKKLGVAYDGHLIVDLTAGDGTRDSINPWECGSSPAIFSSLAATRPNIRVRLFEVNPSSFNWLNENLTLHLPDIGYEQIGDQEWKHRKVGSIVTAINGDGSKDTFADLRPAEWLYVSNDPNNMQGWTLNMECFCQLRQTRFATFMSTMGCNTSGLKRLERWQRDIWFNHIDHAKRIIQYSRWLDLIIFEITNDPAQWAYLQLVPRKWTSNTIIEMSKHFRAEHVDVRAVSFWDDFDGFDEMCNRLFLTKKEREEDAA